MEMIEIEAVTDVCLIDGKLDVTRQKIWVPVPEKKCWRCKASTDIPCPDADGEYRGKFMCELCKNR